MAIFSKSSFLDRSCYIKFATPVTIRWCCNLGSKALLWKLPRRPNKILPAVFFIGFWSADWKGDSNHLYTSWWQLKYFLFSPRDLGKIFCHFDEHIFQIGWFNHQPVYNYMFFLFFGGLYNSYSTCCSSRLSKRYPEGGGFSFGCLFLVSNTSFPHWMTAFFPVLKLSSSTFFGHRWDPKRCVEVWFIGVNTDTSSLLGFYTHVVVAVLRFIHWTLINGGGDYMILGHLCILVWSSGFRLACSLAQ